MVENTGNPSLADVASDIEQAGFTVRGVADILGTMACSSTDGDVSVRAESMELLFNTLCKVRDKLNEVNNALHKQ